MTASEALREMRKAPLRGDGSALVLFADLKAWANAIEAELKVRKLAIKDFILRWRISSGLHAQQILDELEALYQIEPSDYAEKPRFTAEQREALGLSLVSLDHSCRSVAGHTARGGECSWCIAAAMIRAMLETK